MPVDDSAGQSPLGDPDQGDSNRGTSGQSGSDRAARPGGSAAAAHGSSDRRHGRGAAGSAARASGLVLPRRAMAPMVGPLVGFG